jgi:hypothetical protein
MKQGVVGKGLLRVWFWSYQDVSQEAARGSS